MPPKSDVWRHFLTENKTTARCRRCSATVVHSGNTTNLWTHLRSKHGISGGKGPAKPGNKTASAVETPSLEEDDPEPVGATGAASTSSQATSIPSSKPPDAQSSSSTSSTTKRLQTVPVYEAFRRQASLEVGGDKHNAITEALIFMIVKDSMPFQTPEKEGFKQFLKVCVPLYKPISRQSVTRMVESKYDLISAKVKNYLDKAENVSLTCDIWTDTHTNQSYLGLTVHFLPPDNMELQTIMLEVIPLEERHTALNIVKDLEIVLQKWSIPREKITAIVTDNGANMKLAVEILLGPQKHLSCLAHSLNLVAPEAIKSVPEIDLLRDKVKTIVAYFKRSVPASDALRQAQVRTGCQAPLKLKQDVQTRFYSTYIMLERFVNLKDHIASAVISLPGGPDMLTGSELNVVQELLSFLKPFQAAINELSAEKSVTCSKVIPLVSCITSAIKNSKVSSPPMAQLKEKFLCGLSKRFPHVEKNDLLTMSTLIDPRFKRIHFTDVTAHANVVTKASEMVKANQGLSRDSVTKEGRDKSLVHSESLWSYHNTLLATAAAQGFESSEDIPVELQQFLGQALSNLADDPLKVWENLKFVYPNIFPIAVKFLSIPATSVPCERVFSKAGRLVRDDRNRLNPKKIGQLCFLSSLNKQYWSV